MTWACPTRIASKFTWYAQAVSLACLDFEWTDAYLRPADESAKASHL